MNMMENKPITTGCYENHSLDPFGDLLLNYQAIKGVFDGTANYFDCNTVESLAGMAMENMAKMALLFGGMLQNMDFENLDEVAYNADSHDFKVAYCAFMQMTSGMMTALPRLQAACIKQRMALQGSGA